MTDTLPKPPAEQSTYSVRDKEQKSFTTDIHHWVHVHKLIYQMVLTEHKLNESKLVDFLIPSYRHFVREFALWKTGTFPVLESLVSEYDVCSRFLEVGQHLNLVPLKLNKTKQSLANEKLLIQLEQNFTNALSVNHDEMTKIIIETASFDKHLKSFLKHVRHYYETDTAEKLVPNRLINNIVEGKITSDKKILLYKLVDLILEIKVCCSNIDSPSALISNIGMSTYDLGLSIERLILKVGEFENTGYDFSTSELRIKRLNKLWKGLTEHARQYN